MGRKPLLYLKNGCYPDTYEGMQAIPVLKTGILPYAGDDGPDLGQSYRMAIDLDQGVVTLAYRFPNEAGKWSRTRRKITIHITLPDPVLARLQQGEAPALTLREVGFALGKRYAVLDFMVQVAVETMPPWEEMQDAGCARLRLGSEDAGNCYSDRSVWPSDRTPFLFRHRLL